MRKRLFSILLAQCMVLCLMPTTAFAEDSMEETAVCTCEMACTEETMNAECPICGAEGAPLTDCAQVNTNNEQQTANAENGFEYTVTGDEATITGYTGSAKNIVIPSELGGKPVTAIADKAFYEYKMHNIYIPKTIKTIGEDAFRGTIGSDEARFICYEGTENEWANITVQKGNEGLDPERAGVEPWFRLYECNLSGDMVYQASDDAATLVCYFGSDSKVDIPAELGGKPVTSIGVYAFWNCRSLTKVTIPEGVTSIGESAFQSCISLTEVNIPKSVETIGDEAFETCDSLTEVTIPEGVTSIGVYAFQYCNSLPEVTIPEGVTSIGDGAFAGCRSLTEVTISEGVTSIGETTFAGCRSLTEVTIPKSVTSIGGCAFQSCSSLTKATIPEGVTSIRGSVFEGCSSLREVTIPKSVTSIESQAFYNCGALATVYYGGTQEDWDALKKNISEYNTLLLNANIICAIQESNGFAYTVTGDEATITGYTGSAENIVIPSELSGKPVTAIADKAFEGYKNIVNIYIPKTIKAIGEDAFQNATSNLIRFICYEGTENEWANIAIQKGNEELNPREFDDVAWFRLYECNLSGDMVYQASDDAATLVRYFGSDSKVDIPVELGGKPVTEIGEWAFAYYSSLTEVTIPEGVTSIRAFAFRSCSSLTKVIIPEGVTSIGDSAFLYCSSLREVTIPKSVTSIESFAFCDCGALATVYYGGTQEDWDALKKNIGEDNDPLLNANVIYKGADYTKVDEAIAKANALNKDDYKDFSAVEAAINAVVRDKNITEQSEVDAMAKAIEDAIAALQYKDADYTKVDEAIAKANTLNKDDYKDFSGVEAAINAVVRDKNITEQSEVDAMAKAIEDAIAALQYKGADYTKVDEAIAKANTLNKDDYKDFSGVEAAINAVVRDKNITEQSEVDAMAKAIEDAIAALQYKEKPKICKGGKEVKISNGAHEMRIHGKSYGTFTFAWVNDKAGWSIQNADGKYLSFDNGKLVLRDTAYVWKYDAKFYTTTEEKTSSGWGWWGWWGRPSTKVTNWYLVGDGTDLSISKSDTNADVKLYDAMESTEHSFGKWTPAEDGKHTRTCTICGATETGDCTYENGACTVCGALDPDNASVSVSATVTKRTSGGGGWWWWNRPMTTTWEARITATGTGVDIDKVEYSDDGKHYLTGTSFTSDTEITKFYIRVTDSKGNVTNWLYENGKVTQK